MEEKKEGKDMIGDEVWEGIDHIEHEAEEEEKSLKSTQHRMRMRDCQVDVVRKGKGKDKKYAAKRLTTKEFGKMEKSRTSCVQDLDFPGPSSKRARRSTDVRTSCPWEVDPTSRQMGDFPRSGIRNKQVSDIESGYPDIESGYPDIRI